MVSRERLIKRLRTMSPRDRLGLRWTGSGGSLYRLTVRRPGNRKLPVYELLDGGRVFGCERISEERFLDFIRGIKGTIEVYDPAYKPE